MIINKRPKKSAPNKRIDIEAKKKIVINNKTEYMGFTVSIKKTLLTTVKNNKNKCKINNELKVFMTIIIKFVCDYKKNMLSLIKINFILTHVFYYFIENYYLR